MTEKTNEECEEAIRKFAEITSCDEAFSHSVLQDLNYDLDLALADFFKKQEETTGSSNKPVLLVEPKQVEPIQGSDAIPKDLTFLSWNIDGIDSTHLQKRFLAVLHTIAKTNPEVIFLQEVVTDMMPKMIDLMSQMYHICISNTTLPYFCMTCISKNIRIISENYIPFDNTGMGRGMLVVEAEWKKLKLKLINTHLESTANYSEVRKKQIKDCLTKLDALRSKSDISETLAIFAGDLNLRDYEEPPLPPDIKDAWIESGSKIETKYTWDLKRNDNKIQGSAQMRFDRIYYSGPFLHVDFSLEGTRRIRNLFCFPSDHFAVVCRFYRS